MNLKSLFLALSFLVLGLLSINNANAQWDKIVVRVEAGATASRISNYNSGSETLFSYRVGSTASIPVDLGGLEITSGLIFTEKGEYYGHNAGTKANGLYMMIPLEASYRFRINRKGAMYIHVGPYFAYGLSGYIFDKQNANKAEFGMSLSGMVEYKNIIARLGGDIGFTPVYKNVTDTKNYQLYLTLGYRLFNW